MSNQDTPSRDAVISFLTDGKVESLHWVGRPHQLYKDCGYETAAKRNAKSLQTLKDCIDTFFQLPTPADRKIDTALKANILHLLYNTSFKDPYLRMDTFVQVGVLKTFNDDMYFFHVCAYVGDKTKHYIEVKGHLTTPVSSRHD